MKECKQCKIPKPIEDFCKNKKSKDGLLPYCRSCNSKRRQLWRSKYPERERNSNLLRRYNISFEEFKKLYEIQNYKCAICLKDISIDQKADINSRTCVDHCHETKHVRGLLCNKCNMVLGLINDEKKILFSMIEYLESKN